MNWFTRVLLCSILCVFVASALSQAGDMGWDNDFSKGLRGWQLGRNATLKREEAMLYIHLVGPHADGIADCRSPLIPLDGKPHEYELACTYRTDVEHSSLHSGAWFIYYKLDANQKLVGNWTGWPLKPASAWTTATATVKIPEGVRSFRTAIRIQSREGKILDIRTVSLKKIR